MKKLISFIAVALLLSLNIAHADVLAPRVRPGDHMAAQDSVNIPSGTIIDYVGQLTDYLGVREGVFYDFGSQETKVYSAATLYTFDPAGISVSVGLLDLDGAAATVDYNIGQALPDNNLLQYWYVGGGVGFIDKSGDESGAKLAYGFDTSIKLSF